MGRRPCCAKEGLNRGAWSAREDRILTNYIKVHGEGKWRDLPQRAGLKRCGKSCRLRWLNYLRPDIKRGNISKEEEELIIRLHKLLGNRWSLIAGRLPGRTDNEIKNYWNTNLSKRVNGNTNPQCSKKQLVDPCKEAKSKEKTNPEIGNHSPHQVIRTKAVRCTKVVDIPQRSAPPPPAINSNRVSADQGYIDSSTQASPSENYSSGAGDDDDLLMDFDIGDLLLEESPSSNLDHANYEMNSFREEGDDTLPSLDLASFGPTNRGIEEVFADDIAGHSSCHDPLAPNAAFDLESLAKFLGSEEEWI